MAAVVANVIAPFCKTIGDTPDLIYPYIPSAEDQADEAVRILQYVQAQNGDVARQHGDSPGDRLPGDAAGCEAS